MLVRLLGGVEVAAADGWTRAGPPKRACVLAALALSPGAPVSLGDLIRRVWGDDPPESAVTVLYGHMTWLRTLLRDCADMSIRRSTGGGYLLEIDAEQIDLYAARSLAKRARRQSETGRHGLSVSLWRQVCDLARGEALAGVSGDWAAEVRAGFRREHLSMLAERFDAELAAGQHAAVVGELAELAARHPADESMTGRLMTALYRCGRPAEALDAFSQIRQRLADELGVDPSDQLRKLHLRILQQDPGLEHVEDETDAGPFADEQREADAAPPVPAELPADAAGFAGRDAQVEQLCVQAAGNGVLVVDGMAGVGKTA
ncbi:MAG: AfsR/SARP family transcriptional regulator, partial [Stackebrandtia sp.]